MSALLEGRSLTKIYDGVAVVENVDIAVRRGEIRAVVGENGAGKSTLMNMLTGVTRPDCGEIRVRDERIELSSPRMAALAGIAIVHQELNLSPLQSIADNVMLMRPPNARAIRRGSQAESAYVRSATRRVGLHVDPDTPVATLSIAECQMLEIAKALVLQAEIIIFDEPTAALLPPEVERLLVLIDTLRGEGKGILYVSHALDDVLRLANRISVLRDGRLVRDLERVDANRDTLIQAMVDRPAGLYTQQRPSTPGNKVVLAADCVCTGSVRDITFELHAGEVLGFAGLLGGGMDEAILALCGERAITNGRLMVEGLATRFRTPYDAARAGIMIVPEERRRDGIVPNRSVCENLHVGRFALHSQRGFVNPRRLRAAADQLVQRFHIRLASIQQPVDTLSGGNQQKVLLARCIQSNPRVLIVASPTRGVDVGAKAAIHAIILELSARGVAVILTSPELEELIGLSHRIAVFNGGRMLKILARAEATPVRVMRWALPQGVQRAEDADAA